jgi:predicted Zn-dependent protease
VTGLKPASYLLLSLLLLGVGGCAGPTAGVGSWVREMGGIDADASRQARAEHLLLRIGAVRRDVPTVRVQVLDNGTAGAYSWPDGSLFVTRGLMDMLDDEELVAALDHELGHLIKDGRPAGIIGLKGCDHSGGFEAECQADLVGLRLLAGQGIPPTVMTRMLAKVKNGGLLPSCRAMLQRRIELLEARLGSTAR